MLVAAIVVGLAETILGYHLIHQHGLIDGDNYMRLVRIRDGLRSGWFTHVVAADNAGAGTVVYWSHAIDAVVLALRAPLLLVLDDQTALFVAGAVAAPLFAALLAAVLVWAPAPLVQRRWLWTAPAMMLFSPVLRTFGTLGNIHHHLPLALMAVLAAACAGRAAAGRRVAGGWCGVCAAIAIWISPEALPYVLMAMGAIGGSVVSDARARPVPSWHVARPLRLRPSPRGCAIRRTVVCCRRRSIAFPLPTRCSRR